MEELVPVFLTQKGSQAVDGKLLHEALDVKTDFTVWIKRMIEYGFDSEIDFIKIDEPVTQYVTKHAYILKIDMAKEICMLQRTEKGKEIRRYFIACENKLREISTPKTLSQALRLAADQAEEIERQQIMIQEMEPKALVADKLLASGDGLSFKEFGSMIGVGQNTLFEFMRRDGYLISEGKRHNLPYQKYLDQDILMVREVVIETKVGNILKPQTLVTPKGQSYFLKKYGK